MGSMVFASLFGVALNLALPFLLPVDEYARYSLTLGFGQLLASLMFEWARIGTLRYAYTADEEQSRVRRTMLAMGYVLAFGLLVTGALLSLLMVNISPLFRAAAIILGYAALQGVFEGQQASARARGDNAIFSARVLTRAVVGLIFAWGCAVVFRTGEAAIVGLALAHPVAGVIGLRSPGGVARLASFRRDEAMFLIRFGTFAALSTSLSFAVPALVRSAAVAALGLAGAGGLLVAIDLSQRVFATIGSTINTVVFQNSVRAVEFGSEEAVRARLRYQMMAAASLIMPAYVAFSSLGDMLASLVVPEIYREAFSAGSLYAAGAIGIMIIRQYSLDPLFVLFGAAGRASAGPAATVATLLVFSLVPLEFYGTPLLTVNLQLVASSVVGLVVTLVLLARLNRFVWPVTDLRRWLGLFLAMVTVGVAFPSSEDPFLALGKLLALMVVFVGGMLGLDVLGARRTVWQLSRGKRA